MTINLTSINRIALFVFLMTGLQAFAETKQLTADDLRRRLEVRGETFVMNEAGDRVLEAPSHHSTWRGQGDKPLVSNWGSKWGSYQIHLHQTWTVNEDGTISVLIEEYSDMDEDPKSPTYREFTGLLKKEEFVLKGFSVINWPAQNKTAKNVMIRLTPSLRKELETAENIDLPIAAENVVVTDNKGFVWTQGGSFDGRFIGLKTHRGTLAFSFESFKGAKEIGDARGGSISLTLDEGLKVTVKSDSAFLPASIAGKVYGLYLEDVKTDHVHGTHTFTSTKKDVFLKRLEDIRN